MGMGGNIIYIQWSLYTHTLSTIYIYIYIISCGVGHWVQGGEVGVNSNGGSRRVENINFTRQIT